MHSKFKNDDVTQSGISDTVKVILIFTDYSQKNPV